MQTMQNEIDEAMKLLVAGHQSDRHSITWVHTTVPTLQQYWLATTGDVWFQGSGRTPMAAVLDFLKQDRQTLRDRHRKLLEEAQKLEQQIATGGQS